ncbi:MAG: hypothetical protein AAFP82_18540 [Bacteroidota bacterium]
MKLHLILAYALLTSFAACNIMQKVEGKEEKTYTMIMDLREGTDPQDIVKKYADYGLEDLKRISKSKNTWSAKMTMNTENTMKKAMENMQTDKRILTLRMADENTEKASNSTNSKKGTSKLGGSK